MEVKCPKCGVEISWEDNKFRPFCSEKCKITDLGAWASEDYKFSENFASTIELELIKDGGNN